MGKVFSLFKRHREEMTPFLSLDGAPGTAAGILGLGRDNPKAQVDTLRVTRQKRGEAPGSLMMLLSCQMNGGDAHLLFVGPF